MREIIIENVELWERDRICDSPDADKIIWHFDDVLSDTPNIVVAEEDVDKLLQIIGRK